MNGHIIIWLKEAIWLVVWGRMMFWINYLLNRSYFMLQIVILNNWSTEYRKKLEAFLKFISLHFRNVPYYMSAKSLAKVKLIWLQLFFHLAKVLATKKSVQVELCVSSWQMSSVNHPGLDKTIYILDCGYKNIEGSPLLQWNVLTQLDAKQCNPGHCTKITAGTVHISTCLPQMTIRIPIDKQLRVSKLSITPNFKKRDIIGHVRNCKDE